MIDDLLIYDDLIEDEIIRDLVSFSFSKDKHYSRKILRELYKKTEISPYSFEKYLFDKIVASENEFSLTCEKIGSDILNNKFLIETVKNDIEIIRGLFGLIPLFEGEQKNGEVSEKFLGKSNANIIEELVHIYHTNGCGVLNPSKAYIWNNGIINVDAPDGVVFNDLVGYEYHKNKIINNTRSFVLGKAYNNILLFGDRGTGKSSCVKAAFNMFKDQRLRIIELSRNNISQIQDIMKFLEGRGLKFILFLDDLSFEENEFEYKILKAHLEGGVRKQPQNVVIYATSNRLHIVRETMSDNVGITNDIHLNDVIQEKLSLSDRFGITITFDTPSPKEYINIIKVLLDKEGLHADEERLNMLAYRWELSNHGRSGRSAVQFIRSVLAGIDDDVDLI